MTNDQLTRNERIRLESLAQAIASFQMQQRNNGEIIDRARVFEKFLRDADKDHPPQ